MNKLTLTAAVLGAALLAGADANASLLTQTSLTAPSPLPGTATVVGIQGVITPSQTSIAGTGYSVSFNSVADNEGVVHGAVAGAYAIPVAGVTGGAPTYLTGDYGSALTPNASGAGNYLSTGNGGANIVISFAAAQSGFSLLWGSVDSNNELDFYSGANLLGSVTGTEVQNLTGGFAGNGYQGFGGSVYVTVNSTQTFDRVVAHSGTISFEFAGAVASSSNISVPEPISLTLLGTGLLGLGLVRARAKRA